MSDSSFIIWSPRACSVVTHEDTAGNRTTTPTANHANRNVPHHSAVSCTLTQSQTDHAAAEM